MFKQPLTAALNYLFPCQCLLCASSIKGALICEGCYGDLPYLYARNLCQQCSLEIVSDADYCGHCLRQPPAFSQSFIPFAYQYPLDNLIHQFKYRRKLTCGKALGQLLADYLQHQGPEQLGWQLPELVIPAPMHWQRRWGRGFNQADILASYVAQALQLPLASRCIQRRHPTQSQKELTRAERQHNLRSAFAINPKQLAAIKGKRIALVDDVVTTTATVRELSQLLIKAGAKDVQVWALARTM